MGCFLSVFKIVYFWMIIIDGIIIITYKGLNIVWGFSEKSLP